mgnify:FL=1
MLSTLDSSTMCWVPQPTLTSSLQPLSTLSFEPQMGLGIQEARRLRVARKAGQNIGTAQSNLAAAYAPMVFHDKQTLLNTMQH